MIQTEQRSGNGTNKLCIIVLPSVTAHLIDLCLSYCDVTPGDFSPSAFTLRTRENNFSLNKKKKKKKSINSGPHVRERTAVTSQPPLFPSTQALENVKNHSRHHHAFSSAAGTPSLSRQGFGYMIELVITHPFDYFALSSSNQAWAWLHGASCLELLPFPGVQQAN